MNARSAGLVQLPVYALYEYNFLVTNTFNQYAKRDSPVRMYFSISHHCATALTRVVCVVGKHAWVLMCIGLPRTHVHHAHVTCFT